MQNTFIIAHCKLYINIKTYETSATEIATSTHLTEDDSSVKTAACDLFRYLLIDLFYRWKKVKHPEVTEVSLMSSVHIHTKL